MRSPRLTERLAYLVLLVLAASFWRAADQITFAARPGTLGPGFWPKAALGLIIAVSVYELLRSLLSRSEEAGGLAADFPIEDEEAAAGPRRPGLLLAGGVLTVAYGATIPILGFVLTTFLFLLLFMYVGRYRNHLGIWLSALIGTAIIALLFLRVVYVSLPRGVPPFDSVTDLVMRLF